MFLNAFSLKKEFFRNFRLGCANLEIPPLKCETFGSLCFLLLHLFLFSAWIFVTNCKKHFFKSSFCGCLSLLSLRQHNLYSYRELEKQERCTSIEGPDKRHSAVDRRRKKGLAPGGIKQGTSGVKNHRSNHFATTANPQKHVKEFFINILTFHSDTNYKLIEIGAGQSKLK